MPVMRAAASVQYLMCRARPASSLTVRPAITRSPAISASGTRTKARSRRRGCGRVRPSSVEPDIAVGKNVDVGGARTPALFMRAVTAELQLHRLRSRQEVARAERGLHRDAQVDERRLVFEPPGRRAVVGRALRQFDRDAVAKNGHGAIENSPAVSDIAAERDQRLGHGLAALRVRVSMTPTSLKLAAIGACGLWIVTSISRTRGNVGQYRVGNAARRRFNQFEFLRTKRRAYALHHLVVGDRVHHLVGARRGGQIDRQREIDSEGLSDLAFDRA